MQTITIPFNQITSPNNIADFRKYIRQEVNTVKDEFDRSNIPVDLFHNHVEGAADSTNTITRYPRILYQILNERPILVGLNEGVEAITLLYNLRKSKWELPRNWILEPSIEKVQITELINYYQLTNWLGLKEDTYAAYCKLDKLSDKIPILENALKKNIIRFLQFSKEVDAIDFNVFIKEIHHAEFVRYKHFSLLAFDITFGCNLLLPNAIGLGKACSHGFGRLTKWNKK